MCRHMAYLGPPRTLRELVYAPPYSLHAQSYAPRMNRYCRVNADGFGVGWYAEGRERPVRYRRAQPIWSDASFADVADVVTTRCAVAAVRSATPGFPVEESCAQPFVADGWLFSHNGLVAGFAGLERKLRDLADDRLPDRATLSDARASVDSALLFALAVGRWRAGRDLGGGLADVVREVAALGGGGRLNLLAADGVALAATAHGDTLFCRTGPDHVVIASEPDDDAPDWRPVPDGFLVTADPGGVRVQPIEEA